MIWELLDSDPTMSRRGETMRVITRTAIEGLYRADPERLLARNRMLFTVPAVRARFLDFARAGVEQLSAGFAARRGLRPEDDLKLQMTATAIVDAASAAFDRWQRADGKTRPAPAARRGHRRADRRRRRAAALIEPALTRPDLGSLLQLRDVDRARRRRQRHRLIEVIEQ